MTLYSLLHSVVTEPEITKGYINNVVTWKLKENSITLVHNLVHGKRTIEINNEKYLISDYKFFDNGSQHEIKIGNNQYIMIIKTTAVSFDYQLLYC